MIGPTLEEMLRDPRTGKQTHELMGKLIEGLAPEVKAQIEETMRRNPPAEPGRVSRL